MWYLIVIEKKQHTKYCKKSIRELTNFLVSYFYIITSNYII